MYTINQVKKLGDILCEYITPYLDKYKIEDIYKYDFIIDNKDLFKIKDKINKKNKEKNKINISINGFEIEEIKNINNSINGFEKNVLLKSILCNKLKQNESDYLYYLWIVNIWGGIGSFKQKYSKINKFIVNILKKEIKSQQFETISSYSKIISFINPDKYFIYDSKVAFVLNWLLLKNYSKENIYFLNPNGRNSEILKYDMDTIINLYEKNDIKCFYEKNDIYFFYCDLIIYLFEKLKSNKIQKAFCIEMFLFGLFEIMVNEMKNKVKLLIE